MWRKDPIRGLFVLLHPKTQVLRLRVQAEESSACTRCTARVGSFFGLRAWRGGRDVSVLGRDRNVQGAPAGERPTERCNAHLF